MEKRSGRFSCIRLPSRPRECEESLAKSCNGFSFDLYTKSRCENRQAGFDLVSFSSFGQVGSRRECLHVLTKYTVS